MRRRTCPPVSVALPASPGYASGFQNVSKQKLRKSRMWAVAKERTPACRRVSASRMSEIRRADSVRVAGDHAETTHDRRFPVPPPTSNTPGDCRPGARCIRRPVGDSAWSRPGAKNLWVRIGRCQVLPWRRLLTLGGVCFHPPPSRGSPEWSPAAGGVGWGGARPASLPDPGASPWALARLTDPGGRSSVGRLSIPSVSTSQQPGRRRSVRGHLRARAADVRLQWLSLGEFSGRRPRRHLVGRTVACSGSGDRSGVVRQRFRARGRGAWHPRAAGPGASCGCGHLIRRRPSR